MLDNSEKKSCHEIVMITCLHVTEFVALAIQSFCNPIRFSLIDNIKYSK